MSDFLWFEGTPILPVFSTPECLREIHDEFLMKDDDAVILTYPRSGTTWLIQIVCLIQNKGDPKFIQSVLPWELSPWIEIDSLYSLIKNKKGLCLFTSHLPFQHFPKSFFSSKAKVIYLIRNPRDVLVSGYFFKNQTKFVKVSKSLEEYMGWFLDGNGICGDWKNHFTTAQAEAFDKIFQEKMKGFPPGLFPWE
ncbi:bile salt sulfotransferase 1-like isoform X2 [Nannospalax galili]|uniref:bile salt sulfotransferase 1-like isoform X2 n=1 Tax=Nannospalax galili TaxID=1026970 RepID=UPI0004ED0E99|nr:bile salt sulfotransferase 1-like isoform X2 [Nannospalax galili]